MNTPAPHKPDLEQRALAEVNAGKGWLATHIGWLTAVVVVGLLAFILGHLVK